MYDHFKKNNKHRNLHILKLLNCFAYKQERQYSLLKSKLPFKKVANFTGKLMQNYK